MWNTTNTVGNPHISNTKLTYLFPKNLRFKSKVEYNKHCVH